jgi:hypothetical protein
MLSPPLEVDARERRKHHRVREIFEEAVDLIAPFFDPANTWGNRTLDHLAYRSLRETYPDLSMEEVHVLVVAAQRVYAERRADLNRAG